MIAVTPLTIATPMTSRDDRNAPEQVEQSDDLPSQPQQLDLSDLPARDDAVGACEIFVDEERKSGEPLADADPGGAA